MIQASLPHCQSFIFLLDVPRLSILANMPRHVTRKTPKSLLYYHFACWIELWYRSQFYRLRLDLEQTGENCSERLMFFFICTYIKLHTPHGHSSYWPRVAIICMIILSNYLLLDILPYQGVQIRPVHLDVWTSDCFARRHVLELWVRHPTRPTSAFSLQLNVRPFRTLFAQTEPLPDDTSVLLWRK